MPPGLQKYWFLITTRQGTRTDIKVLQGQELTIETPSGTADEPCNEDFRVIPDRNGSSSDVHSKVHIGCVLVTDSLKKLTSHYKCGDLYAIDTVADKTVRAATPAMRAAYEAYEASVGFNKPGNGGEPEEWSKPSERRGGTVYQKLTTESKYKVPTVEDDGFIVDRDTWYMLLRNIQRCEPSLLLGHTGCGKTALTKLAAERLGYDYALFDMGNTIDPVSTLLGVHRLKRGQSIFDPARFTKVITQERTVGVLDEISRAASVANNILFPCLDDRRTLMVDMASTDDMRDIKLAESFALIGTANRGNEYSGTQEMDRALLGRFVPLELPYLKIKEESALLVKRCDINERVATHISTIANTIRVNYYSNKLSTFVGTRETLKIGELVADGFPPLVALQRIILPMFDGAEDTESERGTVAAILTTR